MRQRLAVRRPEQLEQPRRRDHRLDAAAVAAAADLAVLADLDVADLPGDAAGAAVQPAAEDDPGTDAAGDLEVDHVVAAARAALVQLGERAEVGVVVGVHGYAEPPLELLAGQQPLPARHDPGPDPGGASVQRGAGTHIPTACSSVGSRPLLRGQRRTMAAARSSTSAPWASTSTSAWSSASTAPSRSATATRTWPWPTSTPATPPAGALSRTSTGGRPLPPLCGRARSSVSVTWPARISSATRLETVVRDSPLARTRSARLIGPSPARRPRTARWLAARSRSRAPELGMAVSLG